MKNSLEILVISDLHAHPGDPNKGNAPSAYSTNSNYGSPDVNPLADIPNLLKNSGLLVDWILCPGDLSDKADLSAQKAAWEHLEKIRAETKASRLIGAPGNHDIDSRRLLSDFDPKGALQTLVPTFPTDLVCYAAGDKVYADRFWSNNFVVIPFDEYDCSLVILNSCAFHGYSSDVKKAPNEHLRGKLSPLTLAAIKAATEKIKTRLNVLLVHHHPIKLPYVDDGNSIMIGGDKLLDVLKSTGKQWLVIHGHQHVPNLMYADSSTFAPVVLSAGSVAAKTWRMKGGPARNQIHHVALDLSQTEVSGVQILGQVTSWTWAYENGWQAARGSGIIPYKSGFGYRFDPLAMRDWVVKEAKQKAPQLLLWEDVVRAYPKLPFVTPSDREDLIKLIRDTGAKVECDQFDMPTKLEWPP